jgi:hypothetical protein
LTVSKKEDKRRFHCLKCDAIHHYAPQTCQECGFGNVGEKPIPLNVKAFPIGKQVVARLGGDRGSIRGIVENVVVNSWGAKVHIRARHDDKVYPLMLSQVFWECQAK